jgi:hypothetical protein
MYAYAAEDRRNLRHPRYFAPGHFVPYHYSTGQRTAQRYSGRGLRVCQVRGLVICAGCVLTAVQILRLGSDSRHQLDPPP